MKDPLLPAAIAVVAGIAAARYLAFGLWELGAAICILGALALLSLLRESRRAAGAACLAGLFFGGALVGVAHRPPPAPELDTGGDEVVILSGCIVEPPAFSEDLEQLVLEIGPHARARVNLYAREGETLPALRYGQRIEFDARVRRVRNFGNPGAFDQERFLARKHVYWTASGRAASVRVVGECGTQFRAAIFAVRSAVLERIERLYGDARDRALMQALLLGHSAGLERAWVDVFRRTGTYHALVVSGLHVTLLAGVFLFLMRLCACPPFVALALASAGGWGYAVLCGWEAPVVRSAAGFTLFALGKYCFRRARLLNLLAAIALMFVLIDAEQIFDASFQLSFLSVAVLGALAAPLIERTSQPYSHGLRHIAERDYDLHLEPRVAAFRLELRLLAETARLVTRVPGMFWLMLLRTGAGAALFVYELAAVSAVMQFGLALPMALYFHRLSVTGVTANVVIVPLTSVAVPLGFAAAATGWRWLGSAAGWLVEASRWVAEWHMKWETGWRIPDPPWWLAALLTGSLGAIAVLSCLARPPAAHPAAGAMQPAPRDPGKHRRLFAIAAAGALLAVLIAHPFPPQTERGTLELTAIDVGQGECLFLALPDGKLMLVDTGGIATAGRRRKPRLDIGEDVVSPYLWSRSVRKLDAVAVTHGHADHSGGLQAILDNFRPARTWMPGSLKEGSAFDFGGARFSVLHSAASDPAENNDSLVLRVAYGKHSFLLTGDIEEQVESGLVERGAIEPSEVLKVAHHGSRTSSSREFLAAARPAVAVISAGFENQFRNPHPAVLQRLEAAGARTLRTDLCGLLTVKTDGRRLRLDMWRWRERARPLY